MSKHDDQFLPEQVDEQIDALERTPEDDLARSFDARLVANLHQICTEDSELLKRVRTRLETYRAQQRESNSDYSRTVSHTHQHTDALRQKGPSHMKSLPDKQKGKRKLVRILEMVAVILIAALLVGSTALLLHNRQTPSQSKAGDATPTPTATPTSVTVLPQNALYAATQNGLARLDLTTGNVVWRSGSGLIDDVFVDGNIVVFAGGNTVGPGDSSNYYVEGVNASTGQKIWSIPYSDGIMNLQGTNGIVYVNVSSGESHIDALRTSDGAKLWSYPSSLGTIWELYQDGVVYGISYSDFFALNAATGHPLWQKNLQAYSNQMANMTPVVSNGAMYFSTCNTTKQTPDYGSCAFFAFNATNGSLLWHIPFGNQSTSNIVFPAVANGVLYVSTMDGVIHALNPANGALLWTFATSGGIFNPILAGQNMLYVKVLNATQTAATLLALKVTTTSHTIAWSQPVGNSPGMIARPTMLIADNLLYTFGNNAIQVLQADTGTPGQAYHTTAQLAGPFVVVGQSND